MGNAQTFAPKWIPIASCVIPALVSVVLIIGRGLGRTPQGFSERAKNKYYFSMLEQLALGVFYLCVALSSQFGHNLIGGHWVPDGMWIALGIANVAGMYATSMAFSAYEPYAWVTTGLVLVESSLYYMGARSTDVANVAVVVTVINVFAWLARGYYFLRWCTPSLERQKVTGGLYTWYRVALHLLYAVYPIIYGLDVTYGNVFHDKERDPWIVLFVFSSLFIHGINTILCNFVFNTEPLPPFGFWSSLPDSETDGAPSMAVGLEQKFNPNPEAALIPGNARGSKFDMAANDRYGGYNFS